MFSIKGGIVFALFLGSGTTVKLVLQNERNSVGCEIDETVIPLILMKTAANATAHKLCIAKCQNCLSNSRQV